MASTASLNPEELKKRLEMDRLVENEHTGGGERELAKEGSFAAGVVKGAERSSASELSRETGDAVGALDEIDGCHGGYLSGPLLRAFRGERRPEGGGRDR